MISLDIVTRTRSLYFFLMYDILACHLFTGGNFHLKVGGAKSSGNAGDPMLGVAVSGGSRIYKRGGA